MPTKAQEVLMLRLVSRVVVIIGKGIWVIFTKQRDGLLAWVPYRTHPIRIFVPARELETGARH